MFDRENANNEEIRAERKRRYEELWSSEYYQIEDAGARGISQIRDDKNAIRAELPYKEE